MPLVPLLGTGVGYKSRTVSEQRRVNLYVEINKEPDKAQVTMYGTPGLNFQLNVSATIRGTVTIGNVAYIVAGNAVAKQDPYTGFSFVSVGTMTSTTGRVGMATNGTQILIVDGSKGYIMVIATGVLTAIADVNFPNGATTCCFLNGYFIVEKPNTGQFWWSNVYDGTTWNALQFATAESNPDNLIRVEADHGILLLFGERTLEFWGPSGTTTVFQRIAGAAAEWGLAAKWSFDRFSDNSVFLAQNRMGQFEVVSLQGYQITSIGDPNVIEDMNKYITMNGFASLASVTAFTYMLDKHPMYQINFPQKSYLYDGQSDTWNEVSGYHSGSGGRHYADVHWSIGGNSYCSDYRGALAPSDPDYGQVGFIYLMDPTFFFDTNSFEIIVREWETKHVFADLERLTIKEFFVEAEPATALNADVVGGIGGPDGTNPQMSLTWSKDGGFTWGNEIFQPMGKIGQYLVRTVWRMLGRARDFVFRLKISEPVKVVITNVGMIVE